MKISKVLLGGVSIGFFITTFLFYTSYLPQINFHQPVNIKIHGFSPDDLKKVKVYGTTPTGNTHLFYKSVLADTNRDSHLLSSTLY